jgi:hypothetical protein
MEYFDIAGTFSDHPAHFADFEESAWESLLIIIVGTLVVAITRKLLKRLRYLEGLLHICSFCRKIRVGDEWIPLEQYVATRTDAAFSHGFCPECGEKHYGDLLNRGKQLSE